MYKRIAGRLVKAEPKTGVKVAPPPKLVIKDGNRLAVLRPTDPEVAKRVLSTAFQIADDGKTGKIDEAESEKRFNAILRDGAERTFVGLLTMTGRVVDPETLADLGAAEPGDSFVSYHELLDAGPEIMKP